MPASLASRYLSVPLALVLLVAPIVMIYKDPQLKMLGILLIRKLVISVALVGAIQYPVYVIGLILVMSLCTLVILPAQRPIEWKV